MRLEPPGVFLSHRLHPQATSPLAVPNVAQHSFPIRSPPWSAPVAEIGLGSQVQDFLGALRTPQVPCSTMAKPMDAGCSYSTRPLPKRRRRSPQSLPSSHPSSGPSPGLLSLLAAIAASTTSVHGSPAPLPFLCPSLDQSPQPEHLDTRATPVFPSVPLTPDELNHYAAYPRHVPDKFVRGDDGRWRKADAYTLYGSTVCPSCREPTNAVSSVDDQIQSPGSPDTSPSTPSYDIRDGLPPGWKHPTRPNTGHITLILAVSLVLAFIICFLIISCLFWRKRQRRKLKQSDIEARKRRRTASVEDDIGVLVEKEIKIKQKIWARATARWKANVRHSARQRRGKRIASTTRMSQSYSSATSLGQDPDDSIPQLSSCIPSRNLSRRSSIEPMCVDTSQGQTSINRSFSLEENSTGQPVFPVQPSSSRLSASPPAYQQPASSIKIQAPQDSSLGRSTESSMLSPYSVCARCSSIHPTDPGEVCCPRPFHAHVATDDKTLLAGLAALASSPPSEGPNLFQGEFSTPEVSAPVWHDEEVEDFEDQSYDPRRSIISTSKQPSGGSSSSPLFPSPPSKGKMAAHAFYDYPYTFEDMSMEPDLGPAAPPFEAEPSAPPVDAPEDLVPSAPPLPEEDGHCLATSARSPAFNSGFVGSSLMPTNHRRQLDADLDTPSPPDTLIPPVQGPVTSDGIPPSYNP